MNFYQNEQVLLTLLSFISISSAISTRPKKGKSLFRPPIFWTGTGKRRYSDYIKSFGHVIVGMWWVFSWLKCSGGGGRGETCGDAAAEVEVTGATGGGGVGRCLSLSVWLFCVLCITVIWVSFASSLFLDEEVSFSFPDTPSFSTSLIPSPSPSPSASRSWSVPFANPSSRRWFARYSSCLRIRFKRAYIRVGEWGIVLYSIVYLEIGGEVRYNAV